MEANEPWVQVYASRNFPSWLAEQNVSLAFTTYQAGKLFFLGRGPQQAPSVFERTFNRCLGFCLGGDTLWLSSLYQIWRLENCLGPGQDYQGCDRLYVPRVGWTTGDLDIHDMAVDGRGRLVFVSTLFSCLGALSERANFTPLWKPPFISKLAAEDRCHLNGLALVDGRPGFVTSCGNSDVTDGWRDQRRAGGCVIDLRTNQTVLGGLSMPHSPRWYRDRLWLLDSGSGHFGSLKDGKFDPLAFCPGYARGLAFCGDFAVIGLSLPRHEDGTFSGLQLDEELRRRTAEARCGLLVIDLRSGDTVHWVRLEGMVRELYDVVVLPGAVRPGALGFKTDEINRPLSVGAWSDL